MPENGLYESIDFKKYWQTEDAFPFLIRHADELAGFVIIDKKGSDPQIDFNMAQFFIVRKFKNKGIGRYVACECFDKFPGMWEVMVMPGSDGAYRFWRSVIREYTQDDFIEYSCEVAHFKNGLRNMFKFSSRKDHGALL
jgi:ribosomal-protein-alanine N-acetyltransferase